MQYVIGRTSRLGNRSVNQDRVSVLERENTVLLVVGDGLGGKSGGELAAQTLITTMANGFKTSRLPIPDPKALLTGLLHKAHFNVIEAGRLQTPPVNPGTTAVVCLIQEGVATWAHVGDSRLYLFRGGVPIYRTRDHSVVESMYEKGQISMHKRGTHPMKNYMTRCIGFTDTVPEVSVSNDIHLLPGDIMLLCTDGLWEPLDDMLLGSMLIEGKLSDALNKTAECAEQKSYPNSDNISAAALQILSLQLVAKAINEPIEKQVARADPVQNAIDIIEETIKLYENEMK
ncbi:MAG: serine/threonine-protein phosphatase [Gammaproteobacteria bacterium]|nr:serine/threonine-protein phosphatase [Gammaproteobacteria bacterium]